MKIIIQTIKTAAFALFLVGIMSFMNGGPGPVQSAFFGEFKIKKILNYYDSLFRDTSYMAYAYLYPDSVPNSQPWSAGNLGQVSYNDIPLSYNSLIRTYTDTLQRTKNQGVKWTLNGNSSSYDNFTTYLPDSFPSFNVNVCLPESLNKSDNFVVNLIDCAYTDEVEVTMWDGQFRTTVPFYRRFTLNNEKKVMIQKNDLSTLSGPGIKVTVSLIKTEYRVLGGKNYKFEKRFDFVKPMPLVNS